MIFVSRPEKNVLIHGELTETNKALCFFLEGELFYVSMFSFQSLMIKACKKSKTMICHV